jgi:hypothetical protein
MAGLPLPPPPPAHQVTEHHLVTPIDSDDLPVAPPQRTVGPPSVLDQPRLAHRVDDAAADLMRPPVLAGADRDTTRNG